MFSFFLNDCLTNFCCLRYVLPDQQSRLPIGQSTLAFGPQMARKPSCSCGVWRRLFDPTGATTFAVPFRFISGLPQISQLSLSFEGCHLPSRHNSAYCMASARILFANLRQLYWCVHHRDNRRKRLFITTTVGHSLWPSKDASVIVACHSWVD